jgi:hypothetical protein
MEPCLGRRVQGSFRTRGEYAKNISHSEGWRMRGAKHEHRTAPQMPRFNKLPVFIRG